MINDWKIQQRNTEIQKVMNLVLPIGAVSDGKPDWDQRCLLSAVVHLPFKIRAKCDQQCGMKVETVV